MSLFSAQPDLQNRPYSFAVSMLVHVTVIVLVFLGIFSAPKIKSPAFAERYAIRHLDLETLYPEVQRAAASAVDAERPHPKMHTPPSGGVEQEQKPVLRQVVQAPLARQTLLQTDLAKPLALSIEVQAPTILISNVSKIQSKTLVAPLPQSPPVTLAKPVIQRQNNAQRLADISIPASELAFSRHPLLPSTTSPLVVSGPKPTPPSSMTTAAGGAQSTSAQIVSLSETQMAKGHVALPPVNHSSASNSQGVLAAGKPTDQHAGHGNPSGTGGEASSKQGSGNASGSRNSAENGQGAGVALSTPPGTTRITRQKEGQFGAVVVGSTLQDRYPEIADVWNGRLAYTVYLPVGLSKSWVLQYSLSRAENAAASGNINHIDAPWPYSIVRPNIEPGAINADALMIHGFVNQVGRFEALAVAFPPEFAQTQFVLNALAQWQFRPATQNGQNVKVEVLLIIPEVQE